MAQIEALEVNLKQAEYASESLLSSTVAHLLNGSVTSNA